jgi:hypothetical protein
LPEACPVPAHQGLRADDRDGLEDRWKPSIQHDQEQAIPIRELDATAHPPLQHNQLMSECRVLCLKSALRLERQGEQGQEEPEQRTSAAQSQWTAAFVQRLRELGWIEGRTVAIEYRWAEGRSERAVQIVAELVRMKVDIIVTSGGATTLAAKQATSVIPIVFASQTDPVGSGLVASLARPGGNVTGLSVQSTDLSGKPGTATPIISAFR